MWFAISVLLVMSAAITAFVLIALQMNALPRAKEYLEDED